MTAKQGSLMWGVLLGFLLMYLWRMYQARSSARG